MSAADVLTRLTTALAGRYRVERELGAGGMATVYLAQEVALPRQVVIKVLTDDAATAGGRTRFAREIEIIARLQHPNIVPLLAAGLDDDLLWYVMPYVRGRTMRERLADGRVPPPVARQWLTDVTRALVHAHANGIVHRDIKPENILISEDVAVVADFGIAKALDALHAAADGEAITRVGAGVGTPAYMSPEQVAGDPHLDGRADLYALGLVAWELLQGAHPFASRTTAQQLVIAQLTDVPPRLALGAPALEQLVESCLAKDPAQRPADAAAVLDVLLSAPTSDATAPAPTSDSTRMPSVAVLPFANVGADPAAEYLSDGITDEVLGTLARLPGLRVASRASCFALKAQGLDATAVAQRLNVSAIVEGSVRAAGGRVRVQAQLLDAETGFLQWSDRYDGELADVFALQDEIARRVGDALASRLASDASGERAIRAIVHPAAYERFLQAMHLLRGHVDAARYAIGQQMIEESLAIDAGFARAHLARAMVHVSQSQYGIGDVAGHMATAQRAAGDALRLDPGLAEAWSYDGICAATLDRDWARAERSCLRAVQLDPRDPIVLGRLASLQLWRGRFEECLRLTRAALALDPVSAPSVLLLGNLLRVLGCPNEALPVVEALVVREPENALVRFTHASVLLLLGRHAEALTEAERCGRMAPNSAAAASILARVHGAAGRYDEAARFAQLIESWDGPERSLAAWAAAAWSETPEHERTVHWHVESERRREYWSLQILFEPSTVRVRHHPSFQAMLRRVFGRDPGLSPAVVHA